LNDDVSSPEENSQVIEPPAPPPQQPGARLRLSRRTKAIWIISALALVLIAATAFVSIRALLAKAEVEAALPLASQVRDQVIADDGEGAMVTAHKLAAHTEEAAQLTSDPVWRAFELVPLLGPNFAGARQIAAVVNDVAQQAAGPLTDAAGALRLSDFKPVEGAFNLQAFVDAQTPLAKAAKVLNAAEGRLQAIDMSQTVPALQQAALDLDDTLTESVNSVNTADRAARLVPAMLGASGPRNYLLMFQNPAELRASGGLPGALAILHSENGHISLAQQASTLDLARHNSPVIDLPADTRALYGDITGQYIQDVNLTPDFPLSARIAQEMWRQQFGQTVDGVLAIDPVALAYLLKATGPIALGTGDALSADNAVQLLLIDVYARYANPKDQDGFFAEATSAVFTAVSSGDVDAMGLVRGLAQAGTEGRMLVWSSHQEEQAVLGETTLAGGFPISDNATTRFGVYLNDMTGAKMGLYLDLETAVSQASCRADQRPNYAVTVNLTNNAPADAATRLSSYVTGGGHFGVPPGHIKTLVTAYAPKGMHNLGVSRDGTTTGAQTTTDSGYSVSNVSVELAPGESTTLRFEWLGDKEFDGKLVALGTPSVRTHEPQKPNFSCGAIAAQN
jgi:hypothetical protein